jgi:hypothetical protein
MTPTRRLPYAVAVASRATGEQEPVIAQALGGFRCRLPRAASQAKRGRKRVALKPFRYPEARKWTALPWRGGSEAQVWRAYLTAVSVGFSTAMAHHLIC